MYTKLPTPTETFTYASFTAHVDALVEAGKTTGPNQSADYVHYTMLNQQRAHRVYKTTEVSPELAQAVVGLQRKYTWMVIAEAWCGDVPQNMPVIAKVAELNPRITFEIILRDDNPTIMDQFTTNGGRAVPILVVMDGETGEVITHWGPRPAPAQKMVWDYKAITGEKPPYMEFVKEVQLWYHHDHTRTLQAELLALVEALEPGA